ncbi:ankyrin repeat-containing protein ITN1-like [Diospyros lotus]|uniref:ankyrin repeat-containing protein ITN1-like n=1 Tax=Diospyros lotus TaxID=55363 RepID=UPI0022588EC4|nr:ankyrin repeat-containing protein ITN1-like [Diospyros lotus]
MWYFREQLVVYETLISKVVLVFVSMTAQWGSVKKYKSHQLARKLLRVICKELSSSNLYDIRSILGDPTFTAVLQENVDFVKIVFEECPEVILLEFKGLSIISHAISKGLEKICTFVFKRNEMNLLPTMPPDGKGNTLLHQAAKLSPSPKLSQFLGPALQMQRERQRFKEVEKLTPMFRKLRNKDKKTPEDLFKETHKDLKKEARDWLKDIAQSCSVVATLIVTIMFTAAFTVPGGENDDTGLPRKLGSKYFTIYIISDALSLLFSCTSAMIFLGIHTSLFREDDFLFKLPLALMFGLLTLFLSIATMMMAFGIALFIMLREHFMWISIPMLTLGSIPVSIYAILHVRIFIHVFRSTFRSYVN